MRPISASPWLLVAALLVSGCPHGMDTGDTGTTDTGDTGPADTGIGGSHPGFVRVVTWNIQTVGAKGSDQYNAALAVLGRLDGDVVMINEVADRTDGNNLGDLAADLGYDHVFVPSTNPFGDLRNGAITRLDVVSSGFPDAATLSNDGHAKDLTRLPVELTLDIPGDQDLTVVGEHWKSGFCNIDKFRRAVDGLRVGQVVASADPAHELVLAMGDANAEIDGVPEDPAVFHTWPTDSGSGCYGLPSSYYLGSDLYSQMNGAGIDDNAFTGLLNQGMQWADAKQQDGTTPTRPTSGRRIDYVWYSPALPSGWRAEIFDSRHESLDAGLPLAGAPISGDSCRRASDHLPVVFDLPVP